MECSLLHASLRSDPESPSVLRTTESMLKDLSSGMSRSICRDECWESQVSAGRSPSEMLSARESQRSPY